jgi:hypothetical protein
MYDTLVTSPRNHNATILKATTAFCLGPLQQGGKTLIHSLRPPPFLISCPYPGRTTGRAADVSYLPFRGLGVRDGIQADSDAFVSVFVSEVMVLGDDGREEDDDSNNFATKLVHRRKEDEECFEVVGEGVNGDDSWGSEEVKSVLSPDGVSVVDGGLDSGEEIKSFGLLPVLDLRNRPSERIRARDESRPFPFSHLHHSNQDANPVCFCSARGTQRVDAAVPLRSWSTVYGENAIPSYCWSMGLSPCLLEMGIQ